jgi:alkyl hydroperoxide reductase subunit F
MLYDLIIIGAGPAGLSAAIYAARKKLNVIVVTQNGSDQVIEAHLVDNYLGIPETPGVELIEKFKNHAKKLNIKIIEGRTAKRIVKNSDNTLDAITEKDRFTGKTVIIASGKKYRQLNIPGAKEFEGKGITYCATCDAPLFREKVVAVIGGGDAGQDTAWDLTKYAKKIYLLNKYSGFRGQNVQMQERIKNSNKIEVLENCEPVEIIGDKFVTHLIYRCNENETKKEVSLHGIFVEIGSAPTSEFLKDLVKLNEKGEIIINQETNETSCPGIFAAGDVTNIKFKQMIIAAGEGAKAALSAYEYLKQK